MCQEISHISFTLYQLEQTIICVPIIYILSCSAKTRHTMDIIIMIIQRVHIYFALCILSYKLQLRADIMADISLTNYSRVDISEISNSTTYDVWISTTHQSTSIKVSQPTNYRRIHHLLLHIQDGVAILLDIRYDTSHLSMVEIVRPNVYKRVKMPLLLLYRDGIVKLKMYWKIHKIYQQKLFRVV